MGQLIHYHCTCGYDKEIMLGGGLLSNREATVRSVFNDNELKVFNFARKSKILKRFFLEYEPAICPVCRELVQSPVLHFWVGAQAHILRQPCPGCGGKVTPLEEDVVKCPQCGGIMDAEHSGQWD